jgi:inosose dehydratase
MMTRREAIASLIGAPELLRGASLFEHESRVSLSFSLYGMKGLPLDRALESCANIGYDGVELCLMRGWSSPDSLSMEKRLQLRQQLRSNKLLLSSLMEEIYAFDRYMPKEQSLERIRKAAELGHELTSDTPKIESVLGGKPTDWEDGKHQMVERVGEWANAAASSAALLCIKAHIGAAVDTPEKLLWLYDQVNLPSLKLSYDYSHYQLLGLKLKPTLQAILPHCAFIHVKDAEGDAKHPKFLLASDGSIDYKNYFTILKQAVYSGPIVVEVSSQLQNAAGYDPVAAARHCYESLSQALTAAHLGRTRNLP